MKNSQGTIHKHLLGGLVQKGGPSKFLTLVSGALKKITTYFPVKIEFTCISMRLAHNFHGKKGSLKNVHNKISLHQAPPPLTSVCEWPQVPLCLMMAFSYWKI